MTGENFFDIALVVFLELNLVLTSLPMDNGMIAVVAVESKKNKAIPISSLALT